jgi:hypothetical protein
MTRPLRLAVNHGSAPSSKLIDEIRRRIQSEPEWTTGFKRLLVALALTEFTEEIEASTVTCEEFQEALDLLVVDQLSGVDLAQGYPDLVAHLLTCEACQTAYSILLESFEEESILKVDSNSTIHQARKEPQRESSPSLFPLILEIGYELVQQALRGPQLSFTRGEAYHEGRCSSLLLHHIIPTPEGDLVIEAEAEYRIDTPDVLDLRVEVATDWRLEEPLEVTLSWLGKVYVKPISDAGVALYRDLPMHLLSNGRDETAGQISLVVTPISSL